MDDIAKAGGVSRPTLYRYFSDRESGGGPQQAGPGCHDRQDDALPQRAAHRQLLINYLLPAFVGPLGDPS